MKMTLVGPSGAEIVDVDIVIGSAIAECPNKKREFVKCSCGKKMMLTGGRFYIMSKTEHANGEVVFNPVCPTCNEFFHKSLLKEQQENESEAGKIKR